MPPKKRAAKEEGKCGEAKKKTNRVPDDPEEEPEGAETQPEQDHEPDAEDEDEDESPALQRIVEFYEAHPYFYNLTHEKYRNTKLKEAELAELAKEIKWTVSSESNPVEKIKRRFKNLRSAYCKLKNRAGSAGKWGQASRRLTSRQEWKLRNLAFLEEVIQPRTQGRGLGRVAGKDVDEDDEAVEAREDFGAPDNEDEDTGAEGRKRGNSGDSQDSASKRNRDRASSSSSSSSSSRNKKGSKSTPDVMEILIKMLLENRRRGRVTEKRLAESATRQPDEREAWGSWLQTVVCNCPKEKFRQFQAESLALSQRYQPTDEGQ
ncbi:uncharacterized protein [Haliotis cracherodii]|uniref:uncharacterized protein n=1 Tax=Haliotis cracherodii TaxID=6455 RepID=UPI0039E9DADB